jgi:hypothetical protein
MKLFGNIRKQLGNLDFAIFHVRKSLESWTYIILNGGKRCGNLDFCHFLCRKKCGNLNFVIFYVGKSAENWTLLFLLAKKVRKVGLCHF